MRVAKKNSLKATGHSSVDEINFAKERNQRQVYVYLLVPWKAGHFSIKGVLSTCERGLVGGVMLVDGCVLVILVM
jgi:hypothetical protein